MKAVNKTEIEAIYPLTAMQQGLLFHHLTNSDDRGFLHVQCTFKGNLNLGVFKTSWQKAVDRHAILRTSVHWKKIEKPVQLVRYKAKILWTDFDWSGLSTDLQRQKLSNLKEQQRKKGLELENTPLSNIVLAQTDHQSYLLLWQCHHLLLDGWSASIILQDVLAFYNASIDGREAHLETIPSYKSYLNWSRKNSKEAAASFWRTELASFKPTSLFAVNKSKISFETETHRISLSESESDRLREIAQNAHITINTLFMGIWALLLGGYSKTNDVTFGTTVSGRSSAFPNIHVMAGMFMNVLPVRSKFELETKAIEFFRSIQDQQLGARKFEYMGLDGILNAIDWPGGVSLFESLFVFENFPLNVNESSHLAINDFQGGVTTTYPLTLIVKPNRRISIDLLAEKGKIATRTSEWFIACLKQLIAEIAVRPSARVTSLLGSLTEPKVQFETADEGYLKVKVDNKYIAPRTPSEKELTGIWEKTFGISPIGVDDNFFDLGGDSLLSIQIISRASELGISLSASQLFNHQSVAELAQYVSSNSKAVKPWEHLVEIRSKGFKAPLFCLHTGGSHFFFYNLLANYIDPDRPIYAVQASGVKDEIKLHSTVEEMSADFVDEIKRLRPTGPYHIMSYCFSTAVGLEITHILKEQAEQVHHIVVDTSSINQNLKANVKLRTRIFRIVKAFLRKPVRTLKRVVNKRIDLLIKPAIVRHFGSKDQKRITKLRDNNAKIYRNYKWRSYDGNLSLLLTKKPYHPGLNEYIVDSWGKLAQRGLNIIPVEGQHGTLFLEPDVEKTAKNLEKCMQEFESKVKNLTPSKLTI